LRECVESALALVALTATGRGLELVADLNDSCPELVVGDVTRFRQVIINLLSNG
jgi:signal transduction histidine kinase